MRFNLLQICHYYSLQNYLDSITNESNKEYNEKWLFIPDHPYRILIIGGSGSGKTNALLNSMKEQDAIDKMFLYAKDLSEPKENIDDNNLRRQRKVLIAFDDMVANIMTNKKFQGIIKELYIRWKKHFTCVYHSALFFGYKRCEIKFDTLFDYENQQQQRITNYCT